MICIYLDDKLSSKLMEDDQDEMDDNGYVFKTTNYLPNLWKMIMIYLSMIYLLRRQIVFQTYGRWSGWNGWYLSRLWYVFT